MKRKGGMFQAWLVVVAFCLSGSAAAGDNWRERLGVSDAEYMELVQKDFEYSDHGPGTWVASRLVWIERIEERRPVLQKDEDLRRKVAIGCEVCDPDADDAARERYFNILRAQTDRRNAEVDATIRRLLSDVTGDYRRQLVEEFDRGAEAGRIKLELLNEESAWRRVQREHAQR